jgi:hypothetical protein
LMTCNKVDLLGSVAALLVTYVCFTSVLLVCACVYLVFYLVPCMHV